MTPRQLVNMAINQIQSKIFECHGYHVTFKAFHWNMIICILNVNQSFYKDILRLNLINEINHERQGKQLVR